MVAIQNGRLPSAFLVQAVNGAPGQELEPQTAKQWAAMVAAAARDGINLRPQADGGIPSCYRSYDAQVYARNLYERGLGAVAAIPGTSNHGFGKAVDILIIGGVWDWLTAHAAEYGFDNNQGRADGEDWHWVCTRVIAGIETTLEDDMPDMNTFLNTPAFDNGPTISEMFVKLNAVWQGLYGTGNPSVPGNGSIVGLIDGIPARVWATEVDRPEGKFPALQELADAKTVAMRVEKAVDNLK